MFELDSDHVIMHEYQTEVDATETEILSKTVALEKIQNLSDNIFSYHRFMIVCPSVKYLIEYNENFRYCPYCGVEL